MNAPQPKSTHLPIRTIYSNVVSILSIWWVFWQKCHIRNVFLHYLVVARIWQPDAVFSIIAYIICTFVSWLHLLVLNHCTVLRFQGLHSAHGTAPQVVETKRRHHLSWNIATDSSINLPEGPPNCPVEPHLLPKWIAASSRLVRRRTV